MKRDQTGILHKTIVLPILCAILLALGQGSPSEGQYAPNAASYGSYPSASNVTSYDINGAPISNYNANSYSTSGYSVPMSQIQLAQAGTVTSPTYTGATGTTYAGGATAATAPAAGVSIGGDIQGTTSYQGDPYGLPEGSSGSGSFLPEIPPFGVGKDYIPPTSSARVWPLLWFDDSWIYAKRGAHGMSMDEFSGRLAIPLSFLGKLNNPIYFVPGAKITWFDGPVVGSPHMLYGEAGEPLGMYYPPGNLPGALYDVYAGFNWTPKLGENLSFDLTIAPWLGTDFSEVNSDSWRFPGWALAKYQFSPRWAVKGGIYYSDRDRYDWVPGLGLIWNPTGDDSLQIDLYYPDAGILWKPDGSLWFRLHGMYGGGRWTWKEPGGGSDQVDVGDLRLLATCGIGEYATAPRFSVTLGWAFDREIRYRYRPKRNMDLSDGFVLSGEARF